MAEIESAAKKLARYLISTHIVEKDEDLHRYLDVASNSTLFYDEILKCVMNEMNFTDTRSLENLSIFVQEVFENVISFFRTASSTKKFVYSQNGHKLNFFGPIEVRHELQVDKEEYLSIRSILDFKNSNFLTDNLDKIFKLIKNYNQSKGNEYVLNHIIPKHTLIKFFSAWLHNDCWNKFLATYKDNVYLLQFSNNLKKICIAYLIKECRKMKESGLLHFTHPHYNLCIPSVMQEYLLCEMTWTYGYNLFVGPPLKDRKHFDPQNKFELVASRLIDLNQYAGLELINDGMNQYIAKVDKLQKAARNCNDTFKKMFSSGMALFLLFKRIGRDYNLTDIDENKWEFRQLKPEEVKELQKTVHLSKSDIKKEWKTVKKTSLVDLTEKPQNFNFLSW